MQLHCHKYLGSFQVPTRIKRKARVLHRLTSARCKKLETEVDAVVIGAGKNSLCPDAYLHVCNDIAWHFSGIIGLLITKKLLERDLSVALVEKKQLCAGATGAGQVSIMKELGTLKIPEACCCCRATYGWLIELQTQLCGTWLLQAFWNGDALWNKNLIFSDLPNGRLGVT